MASNMNKYEARRESAMSVFLVSSHTFWGPRFPSTLGGVSWSVPIAPVEASAWRVLEVDDLQYHCAIAQLLFEHKNCGTVGSSRVSWV